MKNHRDKNSLEKDTWLLRNKNYFICELLFILTIQKLIELYHIYTIKL